MNKKPNKIVELNDKAVIVTANGLVWIDLDDVTLIRDYHWNIDKVSGYCMTQTNGKKQYLHALIANTPEGMHTDHARQQKTPSNAFSNFQTGGPSSGCVITP